MKYPYLLANNHISSTQHRYFKTIIRYQVISTQVKSQSLIEMHESKSFRMFTVHQHKSNKNLDYTLTWSQSRHREVLLQMFTVHQHKSNKNLDYTLTWSQSRHREVLLQMFPFSG